MIDHGMAPGEAVDAPRLHHQWLPDLIHTERFALSRDTRALLEGMGHTITEQSNWGAAALIAVGPSRDTSGAPNTAQPDAMAGGVMRPGRYYGAIDSRRPAGTAIGE